MQNSMIVPIFMIFENVFAVLFNQLISASVALGSYKYFFASMTVIVRYSQTHLSGSSKLIKSQKKLQNIVKIH